MPAATVAFSFRPGIEAHRFSNVRLCGNWDNDGRISADWCTIPMYPVTDPDGCPAFDVSCSFDDSAVGVTVRWGVRLDGPAGKDLWGIAAEIDDETSTAREVPFVLKPGAQEQISYLTNCARLGANRHAIPGQVPGIRFAIWAPYARAVDLVLADPTLGYIADDGTGATAFIPMHRDAQAVWRAHPASNPLLADFVGMVGQPYMVRVTKDDGTQAFRTDLASRMQIGAGDVDPGGKPYAGPPAALNGPPSCSVVCDPCAVTLASNGTVTARDFWKDEFSAGVTLPNCIEDCVIYELHVGALGYGKALPGTLEDAITLVAHLVDLGVNAVELMPIAQFDGTANWGYGTSHFFAIDQAAGGADRLKIFVKACHAQGIAVILDVCYNHFDWNSERSEWAYDSNAPDRNIYFWYEGSPSDYADPSGGYIDNLSSGWAPRFDEEMVRQVFISSAVWLVETCHIDGFRLDQTSSIHQYPTIHANGDAAGRAAAFGTKFLKQWTRTMRLLKPSLFLAAEDYSDWSAMTQPSLTGDGLGFDATWYGDFHHNLVEYQGGAFAELIEQSGYGDGRPLNMQYFAGALQSSGNAKIVYNESHDDCGNRTGSARTIWLAVNGAPLTTETRSWAEARVRFAAAMTLLSAGSPMFFMGEEIGARNFYRYSDFLQNREDIIGASVGTGALLFGYYKDLIRFSIDHAAIRSRTIQVTITDNDNRLIAFHRWDDQSEFLVVGSLNDTPFDQGFWLHADRLGDAAWTEVFNSDAQIYGGWNIGNAGRTLHAQSGALSVIVPAAGVVVFQRA